MFTTLHLLLSCSIPNQCLLFPRRNPYSYRSCVPLVSYHPRSRNIKSDVLFPQCETALGCNDHPALVFEVRAVTCYVQKGVHHMTLISALLVDS